MKDVTITYNGREYPALETRNITAGNLVCKRYDQYSISVKHNGLISKFFIKPHSFWYDTIYAGSFHYDMNTDIITWLLWSDYDPAFIFIFVPLLKVLKDKDRVLISVRRGRIIERYKIIIKELIPLVGCGEDKYGLYPVAKSGFEKLKSKVYRGCYAKR